MAYMYIGLMQAHYPFDTSLEYITFMEHQKRDVQDDCHKKESNINPRQNNSDWKEVYWIYSSFMITAGIARSFHSDLEQQRLAHEWHLPSKVNWHLAIFLYR